MTMIIRDKCCVERALPGIGGDDVYGLWIFGFAVLF